MTDRRIVVAALASSVAAAHFAAGAQMTEKVWKVGYIGLAPTGASSEGERLVTAFLQVLTDNGFVEGKNLVFERRATEGRDVERAPALVAELIGLRVDVLVTLTTVVTRAAKEATTTIPIVMTVVSDPVISGFAVSLSRPGGNITGMTDFDNDLTSKRLELLKAVAPKAVRVAYMNDDLGMRFSAAQADALNKEHDAAARALGISLLRVSFNAPRDFEAAAATIVRERADALLIGGVSATTLRNEIAEFAMRQRLPSLAAGRSNSLAGALMSYGPDYTENWRKAAGYVARILNGAKPAELPIERPTKLELIINLKTANAIGLTIPQSLLLRATEVLQ